MAGTFALGHICDAAHNTLPQDRALGVGRKQVEEVSVDPSWFAAL